MTANAEDATVANSSMTGRLSAKGDNGLSIGRVRCSRKTGRWLPLIETAFLQA